MGLCLPQRGMLSSVHSKSKSKIVILMLMLTNYFLARIHDAVIAANSNSTAPIAFS